MLFAFALYAQYPLIKQLGNQDPLFHQLQTDIISYNKAAAAKKKLSPLNIYRYTVKNKDTLFSIAARTNLLYDTIASLNRLPHNRTLRAGVEILLSSIPGLYIPAEPQNDLEELLAAWRDIPDNGDKYYIYLKGEKELFYFFPGEKYHPTERLFFLGTLFRFPLVKGRISSLYGPRPNPFNGESSFHKGIDIAAGLGTEVMAAGTGVVQETGYNNILGNFIRIRHLGSYETVYGHLQKIFVKLNQKVTSGMIIGEVGNSGLSTGPHLHFEIRKGSKNEDPLQLLPKVKK